jgi:hypothetical protein
VPRDGAALVVLGGVGAVALEDGLAGIAGAVLGDPVGELRPAISRDVVLGCDGQFVQLGLCLLGRGGSGRSVADTGAVPVRPAVASMAAAAAVQQRIIMTVTVVCPATPNAHFPGLSP